MTPPIEIAVEGSRPYTVHVGTFLLEDAGHITRNACGGTRALLVSDTQVETLYAKIVRDALTDAGYQVRIFSFPPGEDLKRADTYLAILETAAAFELDRSDVIVALGGGVVGDLAGFAAATYMRGISFIQIPTTLLAMADSSVGGKTAIDLAAGKNLAGAFWQPAAVIADVGCLATLSQEVLSAGCSELIKHAIIGDEALFCELEATPITIDTLQGQVGRLSALIAASIEIKRAVVQADEHEAGVRKLLNFGHTVGHALEALSGYSLSHGQAVAIGMAVMARGVYRLGACSLDVPQRIVDVLIRYGLPTTTTCDSSSIASEAVHDKKRCGNELDLVLPQRIGACSIDRVSFDMFSAIVDAGLQPLKEHA